jgi:hypothetical protein
MIAGRLPTRPRPMRGAAGPRLSLVPDPVSSEGAASQPAPPASSLWGAEAWREVFEDWRWWAGAGFGLAVLGLAESFALPAQAGGAQEGPGGEWLLAALGRFFEGGPLLRSVLAAAASGALLAVPWLWLQRSRAEQAMRESRRIERSLYAARKKWWPRS